MSICQRKLRAGSTGGEKGCWGASQPPHLWSRMWIGATMLPHFLRMQASTADLWGKIDLPHCDSPGTSPMRLVS